MQSALALEKVAVRYQAGGLGISDVSLDVPRGHVVVLVGPNGAGKSSTLRAASGFLRSEGARVVSGTIRASGEDIRGVEPHVAVQAGVCIVPERDKVFRDLTVLDNLSIGPRARGRSRRSHMQASLSKVFDIFPILAERRRQSAGTLSGGQQKMLAIGRAIMQDPSALLLDEMTLGVAVGLRPVLFDAVKEVARTGVGVLLAEESAQQAFDVADWLFVINNGMTRTDGPPSTFKDERTLAAILTEGKRSPV